MPAAGFSVRDMDSRCDIRSDFDSEADFFRAEFLPCGFVFFVWCLPDWVVLSDFRCEFIK